VNCSFFFNNFIKNWIRTKTSFHFWIMSKILAILFSFANRKRNTSHLSFKNHVKNSKKISFENSQKRTQICWVKQVMLLLGTISRFAIHYMILTNCEKFVVLFMWYGFVIIVLFFAFFNSFFLLMCSFFFLKTKHENSYTVIFRIYIFYWSGIVRGFWWFVFAFHCFLYEKSKHSILIWK